MAAQNPPSAFDEMLAGMIKPKVKPEILLAELDDLLHNRSSPSEIFAQSGDAIAWIGRVAAVITHWDSSRGNVILIGAQLDLQSAAMVRIGKGVHNADCAHQ